MLNICRERFFHRDGRQARKPLTVVGFHARMDGEHLLCGWDGRRPFVVSGCCTSDLKTTHKGWFSCKNLP